MRVGINAYLFYAGEGYRSAGVSTYTRHLLEELPRVCAANEYIAFVNRGTPVPDGIEPVSAALEITKAPARIVWEQLALPIQAALSHVDVLHATVNVLPAVTFRPTVATVHDLSFLRFPDRLSRGRRLYLSASVSRTARSATRVIAVSGNTKRDLVDVWGIAEDRIDVVYPGVDPAFRPFPERPAPLPSHSGTRPYILHVGTLEPRKNIDVLISAYGALRARGYDHALVLIGARGWMYEPLFEQVQRAGLQGDVHFLDYVAPADLPRWYNGADLFVYPSAYEGFGLPLLEAMACGVPAVTSSTSSLGELAGNACLTIEPGSSDELEEAMMRALDDDSLRSRLREAGLRRASEFSWARTARETAGVYEVAYRT